MVGRTGKGAKLSINAERLIGVIIVNGSVMIYIFILPIHPVFKYLFGALLYMRISTNI